MIVEADIWRAAHEMIEIYELDAGWQAALRADRLLEQGDVDGFRVWTRIVNAIRDLQQIRPPDKDMRH